MKKTYIVPRIEVVALPYVLPLMSGSSDTIEITGEDAKNDGSYYTDPL